MNCAAAATERETSQMATIFGFSMVSVFQTMSNGTPP